MSHVLLSGDPGSYPGLKTMLLDWGLTVGELEAGATGRPDVSACDVVIHVGTGQGAPGAMPDGAQEAGGAAPAAPLLVLGIDDPVPGACESVPGPGPGGVLLRAAVARACRLAQALRGDRDEAVRAEARQFLGHELRSPLAAIQTALDALDREDEVAPDLRRMVELAARNVRRLAATVEWSQDLRDLAEHPPALRPRPVPVEDLLVRLPEDLRPVDPWDGGPTIVLTDPGPLETVLRQLVRVVDTAGPSAPVAVRLQAGAESDPLRLILAARGPMRPVGGVQGEGSQESEGKGAPLERLVQAMCAGDLITSLGMTVREYDGPDDEWGLILELPKTVPAGTPC